MTLEEGTQVHGHGAGRPRPQGRVREAARADAARGLLAASAVDGELRRLDEEIELDKKYKHDISVVVDRLVMKADLRRRLSESVEAAAGAGRRGRRGRGARAGSTQARRDPRTSAASRERRAPGAAEVATPHLQRAVRLPQLRHLDPRARAADLLLQLARTAPASAATGSASSGSIDPELVVPDPTLSLAEGALQPWRTGHSRYWKRLIEAVAEDYGVDLDDPVAGPLRRGPRDLPLRHRRRAPPGHLPQPLRPPPLLQRSASRGSSTTSSAATRRPTPTRSASGSRATWPSSPARPARAPGCGRRASRSRSAGSRSHEYTEMSARAALELDRGARDDRDRAGDRAADRPRDHRAARLPRQRRHRLPVAGALGPHAVRRRGAADPARDPDRLQPGRRALHPRRALDRAAPARQREADRDPRAPARPRQHGDRGRARRGDDARRRPPRRPRPRRRRARRPRGRRGHAEAGRGRPGLAHRPVPRRQAPDRGAGEAPRAARRAGRHAAPASTT